MQAWSVVLGEMSLPEADFSWLLVGDGTLGLDARIAVLSHLTAEARDGRDNAHIAFRPIVTKGHAVATIARARDGMALAFGNASGEEQAIACKPLDVEVHDLPTVDPTLI